MSAVPSSRSLMSIGEVLAQLRTEFPDVTISKIRFLESEGLVEPARTPSGYRKFSHADVARLRYVLATQRDHYLPLRVIKEHLDALDRGLEPPAVPGERPRVPSSAGRPDWLPGPRALGETTELRLSRDELVESAGIDADLLTRSRATAWSARSAAGRPVTGTTTPTPWWSPPPSPRWPASASSRGTCGRSGPRRTARPTSSSRSWRPCCASAARRPGPGPRRSRARWARSRCGCTRPWSGPGCATSSGADTDGRHIGTGLLGAGRVADVNELDVVGVRVEMPSNQPIVLLKESGGERYLPIWIGAGEATAIAFAQQGVVPPRPLTHDLIRDLLEAAGQELTEVRITALRDGVFYAEMVFASGLEVSARPSDAIAVALRTSTPIFGAEEVLGRGGDQHPGRDEQEDEVEKFREFLDQISPEDFQGPA